MKKIETFCVPGMRSRYYTWNQ